MPSPTGAARRTHGGRPLVTREDMIRELGVGRSTAEAWYRGRACNGHPQPVLVKERHDRKVAGLTPVHRTGGADDLLDRSAAAELLGYSGPKVIDSYRARNVGNLPDPDAIRPLRWRRATLWAFADWRSRPGRSEHTE